MTDPGSTCCPGCESSGRLISCRKGAAALEFALVVPLLLLVLFGSLQYGSLFYTQNSLQTIARNGARALADGRASPAEVETAARQALPAWVVPSDVSVNAGPIGADQVRVAISVPSASAAVSRLAPMPASIGAEVVMRQEPLAGAGGG